MVADPLSSTFSALADPTRRASDRVAQQRPARLRGLPLADAADWLARYRGFFEDSFDRLEEHLRAIQNQEGHDG